jgi:hypothetical protein
VCLKDDLYAHSAILLDGRNDFTRHTMPLNARPFFSVCPLREAVR